MEKAEVRRQVREILDRLSDEERAEASEAICEHVLTMPEFPRNGAVMLFASLPDEFDTTPLMQEALTAGRVYLPRVDWRTKKLLICRVNDLAELEEGYMGIMEPPVGETAQPDELDFILAPGLAFDWGGNRLGRGGGYYDRLLSSPGLRAVSCGAAFQIQVVDYLPHGPNDRPVDILVTELGAVRFKS